MFFFPTPAGLFDDSSRIRLASVQLLGDLLYRLSGATGKTQVGDDDDDEGIGTEEGRRAILNALGQEKRDTFLAGLYILRCDVSLPVRQVCQRGAGAGVGRGRGTRARMGAGRGTRAGGAKR